MGIHTLSEMDNFRVNEKRTAAISSLLMQELRTLQNKAVTSKPREIVNLGEDNASFTSSFMQTP
jgi:hypothetical protein